jgi:hypothetical protein
LRFELVEFLLETNQLARADSEIIAASIDLPDDPSVRLALAGLFLRAANPARAAEQYELVLKQDPTQLAALEGAVESAFALGDYRRVAGYRLPDSASSDVVAHQLVAREVMARDPLAPRLSAAERRRRLLLNLTYIEGRWKSCYAAEDPPAAFPESLVELRRSARRAAIGRDTEALEAGLVIIDQLRQRLEQACGPTTPVDQALTIIIGGHGIGAS